MTDREISLLRNDIIRLQGALDHWKQSWNSLNRDKKQLEQELRKKSNMLAKVKRYFGISVRKNRKLQQELQKTREDIKNGYHEAYGLDSDLTIDELSDRVRLMHSWVKQHQYAVESFNNIKNQEIKTLKEQLAEAVALMKTQKDCIDHLLGKRESFGDSSTVGFGTRVDAFLEKQDKENKDEK